VAIRGDTIEVVGRLDSVSARRVIDATGRLVVPGFIDMHSHADRALASNDRRSREAYNLVAQGITTVVFGPDGRNPIWPIADEIAAYRRGGTALNVVPMVGHGTVRGEVMGDDYERPATLDEIARMRLLVRDGMDDGAWGMGAGPEYRPGRFSTTDELIALARVVAEYDGFYYAHQRSQSPLPRWQTPSIVEGWRLTGTEGMRETIEIGRATGIRVVGSHIKAKGPSTWGHSSVDVLMIERARAEGVQVYLDQYPYETFGGGATGVIPPWGFAPPGTDRSGGNDAPLWRRPGLLSRDNLRANLDHEIYGPMLVADIEFMLDLQGGGDRHIIVDAPHDPTLIGATLSEIAAANERTPVEQLVDFAMAAADDSMRSGVLFRPVAGHRFDVENYMRQEYTATGTDAGVSLVPRPGQHPRYFGSYSRKLVHYVAARGIISLPFAIRSSTGLPAQIIGLPDRGYVRAGQKADLVVLDFAGLEDRATILDPGQPPIGFDYVMVNGTLTVDDGEATGALPGVVLVRSEVRAEVAP
jgi:N-acyl-D-amino-acid deacylase